MKREIYLTLYNGKYCKIPDNLTAKAIENHTIHHWLIREDATNKFLAKDTSITPEYKSYKFLNTDKDYAQNLQLVAGSTALSPMEVISEETERDWLTLKDLDEGTHLIPYYWENMLMYADLQDGSEKLKFYTDKVTGQFKLPQLNKNEAPEREGYRFDKWTLFGNAVDEQTTFTEEEAGSVIMGEYIKIWKVQIAWGFSYLSTAIIDDGATYTIPDLTIQGFRIKGYYYDEEFTRPVVDNKTVITADTIIYVDAVQQFTVNILIPEDPNTVPSTSTSTGWKTIFTQDMDSGTAWNPADEPVVAEQTGIKKISDNPFNAKISDKFYYSDITEDIDAPITISGNITVYGKWIYDKTPVQLQRKVYIDGELISSLSKDIEATLIPDNEQIGYTLNYEEGVIDEKLTVEHNNKSYDLSVVYIQGARKRSETVNAFRINASTLYLGAPTRDVVYFSDMQVSVCAAYDGKSLGEVTRFPAKWDWVYDSKGNTAYDWASAIAYPTIPTYDIGDIAEVDPNIGLKGRLFGDVNCKYNSNHVDPNENKISLQYSANRTNALFTFYTKCDVKDELEWKLPDDLDADITAQPTNGVFSKGSDIKLQELFTNLTHASSTMILDRFEVKETYVEDSEWVSYGLDDYFTTRRAVIIKPIFEQFKKLELDWNYEGAPARIEILGNETEVKHKLTNYSRDDDPEYRLESYNTKPDGTGTRYEVGSVFTSTDTKSVLYMIWGLGTPIYIVDGDDANLRIRTEFIKAGQVGTLSSDIPEKEGKLMSRYINHEDSKEYQPGSLFYMPPDVKSVTLNVEWTDKVDIIYYSDKTLTTEVWRGYVHGVNNINQELRMWGPATNRTHISPPIIPRIPDVDGKKQRFLTWKMVTLRPDGTVLETTFDEFTYMDRTLWYDGGTVPVVKAYPMGVDIDDSDFFTIRFSNDENKPSGGMTQSTHDEVSGNGNFYDYTLPTDDTIGITGVWTNPDPDRFEFWGWRLTPEIVNAAEDPREVFYYKQGSNVQIAYDRAYFVAVWKRKASAPVKLIFDPNNQYGSIKGTPMTMTVNTNDTFIVPSQGSDWEYSNNPDVRVTKFCNNSYTNEPSPDIEWIYIGDTMKAPEEDTTYYAHWEGYSAAEPKPGNEVTVSFAQPAPNEYEMDISADDLTAGGSPRPSVTYKYYIQDAVLPDTNHTIVYGKQREVGRQDTRYAIHHIGYSDTVPSAIEYADISINPSYAVGEKIELRINKEFGEVWVESMAKRIWKMSSYPTQAKHYPIAGAKEPKGSEIIDIYLCMFDEFKIEDMQYLYIYYNGYLVVDAQLYSISANKKEARIKLGVNRYIDSIIKDLENSLEAKVQSRITARSTNRSFTNSGMHCVVDRRSEIAQFKDFEVVCDSIFDFSDYWGCSKSWTMFSGNLNETRPGSSIIINERALPPSAYEYLVTPTWDMTEWDQDHPIEIICGDVLESIADDRLAYAKLYNIDGTPLIDAVFEFGELNGYTRKAYIYPTGEGINSLPDVFILGYIFYTGDFSYQYQTEQLCWKKGYVPTGLECTNNGSLEINVTRLDDEDSDEIKTVTVEIARTGSYSNHNNIITRGFSLPLTEEDPYVTSFQVNLARNETKTFSILSSFNGDTSIFRLGLVSSDVDAIITPVTSEEVEIEKSIAKVFNMTVDYRKPAEDKLVVEYCLPVDYYNYEISDSLIQDYELKHDPIEVNVGDDVYFPDVQAILTGDILRKPKHIGYSTDPKFAKVYLNNLVLPEVMYHAGEKIDTSMSGKLKFYEVWSSVLRMGLLYRISKDKSTRYDNDVEPTDPTVVGRYNTNIVLTSRLDITNEWNKWFLYASRIYMLDYQPIEFSANATEVNLKVGYNKINTDFLKGINWGMIHSTEHRTDFYIPNELLDEYDVDDIDNQLLVAYRNYTDDPNFGNYADKYFIDTLVNVNGVLSTNVVNPYSYENFQGIDIVMSDRTYNFAASDTINAYVICKADYALSALVAFHDVDGNFITSRVLQTTLDTGYNTEVKVHRITFRTPEELEIHNACTMTIFVGDINITKWYFNTHDNIVIGQILMLNERYNNPNSPESVKYKPTGKENRYVNNDLGLIKFDVVNSDIRSWVLNVSHPDIDLPRKKIEFFYDGDIEGEYNNEFTFPDGTEYSIEVAEGETDSVPAANKLSMSGTVVKGKVANAIYEGINIPNSNDCIIRINIISDIRLDDDTSPESPEQYILEVVLEVGHPELLSDEMYKGEKLVFDENGRVKIKHSINQSHTILIERAYSAIDYKILWVVGPDGYNTRYDSKDKNGVATISILNDVTPTEITRTCFDIQINREKKNSNIFVEDIVDMQVEVPNAIVYKTHVSNHSTTDLQWVYYTKLEVGGFNYKLLHGDKSQVSWYLDKLNTERYVRVIHARDIAGELRTYYNYMGNKLYTSDQMFQQNMYGMPAIYIESPLKNLDSTESWHRVVITIACRMDSLSQDESIPKQELDYEFYVYTHPTAEPMFVNPSKSQSLDANNTCTKITFSTSIDTRDMIYGYAIISGYVSYVNSAGVARTLVVQGLATLDWYNITGHEVIDKPLLSNLGVERITLPAATLRNGEHYVAAQVYDNNALTVESFGIGRDVIDYQNSNKPERKLDMQLVNIPFIKELVAVPKKLRSDPTWEIAPTVNQAYTIINNFPLEDKIGSEGTYVYMPNENATVESFWLKSMIFDDNKYFDIGFTEWEYYYLNPSELHQDLTIMMKVNNIKDFSDGSIILNSATSDIPVNGTLTTIEYNDDIDENYIVLYNGDEDYMGGNVSYSYDHDSDYNKILLHVDFGWYTLKRPLCYIITASVATKDGKLRTCQFMMPNINMTSKLENLVNMNFMKRFEEHSVIKYPTDMFVADTAANPLIPRPIYIYNTGMITLRSTVELDVIIPGTFANNIKTFMWQDVPYRMDVFKHMTIPEGVKLIKCPENMLSVSGCDVRHQDGGAGMFDTDKFSNSADPALYFRTFERIADEDHAYGNEKPDAPYMVEYRNPLQNIENIEDLDTIDFNVCGNGFDSHFLHEIEVMFTDVITGRSYKILCGDYQELLREHWRRVLIFTGVKGDKKYRIPFDHHTLITVSMEIRDAEYLVHQQLITLKGQPISRTIIDDIPEIELIATYNMDIR